MKRRFTHIQRFLFAVLLVQFINISFNCVNLYNSGQSGFRHKVSFSFFETQAVADLLEGNDGEPGDKSGHPDEKLILENFELGLFVSLVEINSIPESGTLKKNSAFTFYYQDHVADLNPRPPKTA